MSPCGLRGRADQVSARAANRRHVRQSCGLRAAETARGRRPLLHGPPPLRAHARGLRFPRRDSPNRRGAGLRAMLNWYFPPFSFSPATALSAKPPEGQAVIAAQIDKARDIAATVALEHFRSLCTSRREDDVARLRLLRGCGAAVQRGHEIVSL